jgi:tRNA modification GTPase
VGKSQLLNALAGYQRAIVDSTPGTTRDVVTVKTAFDGWPVELVDTAGLRTTEDTVEHAGIERALRQKETADLVLKVLDRSEPLQPVDRELIASAGRALRVANKADLPAVWEPSALDLEPGSLITVSAERGEGLDGLIAAIVDQLIPEPPGPGAGVPFRVDQIRHLEHARAALRACDSELAIQQIEMML